MEQSNNSYDKGRPSLEKLERYCSGIFINNSLRPSLSKKVFSAVDPSTEQVLCNVAYGDTGDVDDAVDAAAKAFEKNTHQSSSSSCWRALDGPGRGKLLNQLADLLERDAEIVAAIEAADVGKPFAICRAADVDSAIAILRAHAGFCFSGHGLGGSELPLSNNTGIGLCYSRREPIGVVAGILPFNFPLCGAVAKIAPALAAGCTIVIKPSERCTLSPMYLCSLIEEAGFPPGVVNAVSGDRITGQALVSHPKVAKVSFTGSNAAGKKILKVGSDRLARTTLELGGKNACIICPGSDLREAARIACGGNFFNSGQICVGISRVFIPENNYDEFLAWVKLGAESLVVGDQFTDGVEMGPLVDRIQMEQVLTHIEKGISQGAKLVCGGQRIGTTGYFVQPTVLSDVTDDNIVAKKEIFGPVMCCHRYSDVSEAIRRANSTVFGLAAVVISNDIDSAVTISHALEAGTVWINTHGVYDPIAPYQGHKESGLGEEYGIEGLQAYLKKKTVMVKCRR